MKISYVWKVKFFSFYQNFHRKSIFYNINVSLPISFCKEDYPYSTITIKAQMLEGKYKNSEGNLRDGEGRRRRRRRGVIEKREKNWTSRKKEANCVVTFLFLSSSFFFSLPFFTSCSRYHSEGGHMKLASVPTCPFSTYRVF